MEAVNPKVTWVQKDQTTRTKIYMTDEMNNFKEMLENTEKNFSVCVYVLNPCFDESETLIQNNGGNFIGPVGAISSVGPVGAIGLTSFSGVGVTGATGSTSFSGVGVTGLKKPAEYCDPNESYFDNRRNCRPDNMFLSITFRVHEVVCKELPKMIALDLTKSSYDENLRFISYTPITTNAKITYGRYKKPGFDESYEIMKKMTGMTIEEFIKMIKSGETDWSDSMIETSIYRGAKNLLEMIECYTTINSNDVEVTMQLLCSDIGPNFKILESFFKDTLLHHIT